MDKVCLFCNKKFTVSPSRSHRKFCSAKCGSSHRIKYVIEPRQCKTCGMIFTPPQRGRNHAKSVYCSIKCKGMDKSLTERISKKGSETKKKRWADGVYNPPWNKGLSVRLSPNSEFKKGHKPWNKDLKGWSAPGSEKGWFVEGRESDTKQPIGTIVVRKHKVSGRIHRRQWIKVEEPNKWMQYARFMYIQYQGEIRRGCIIHHIDRNPLNDDIENLAMLTRAEHINEHRHDLRV